MQATEGNEVKVHYTGKLDDGVVFDSSSGGDPLSFVIGEHQVIPGFEEAVSGMAVGETKSVHIPSEQAYGPVQDALVVLVDRDRLPAEIKPEVGQQLQMKTGEGQVVPVRITVVGEEKVTLDANHPLAGKNLNFDLELVAIA